MVIVCCICQRIREGDAWVEKSIPQDTLPSHGYCPVCYEAAVAELREQHASDQGATSLVA